LRLLTETARALGYGHTLTEGGSPLGFAHRDVSPENIMVSIDGTAKLIDFGAAVTRACPPPPRTFVGKYRYLAPERLRGADGDARADVYSLGIVLYEYVTGRRPYDGPHIKNLILEGAAPDPCRLVPTLPRRLGGLITKAIAVEPGRRFCNGSEFAEELALLLDHRDLGDVAAAATEPEVLELLRSSSAEADRLVSPMTEPGQDRFTVPFGELHVVVPTVATVAAAGGAAVAVVVSDPLESEGDLDADLDSFERTDSEPRPPHESDDASFAADELSTPSAPPPEPEVRVPDDDTLALSQGASARRAGDAADGVADSASSCFERGLALVAQHQFHAAVALWRRATTLDPQRRSYRTNLERLEKHIAIGRVPAKGPPFRNPPGRS
jgi:serine/threonine protein kinase